MFSRLTGHMRHNVVAYLALFVALGGTSYAAIRLPANSVGPKQIKKNAVRSSEIRKHAVGSSEVRNRSLLAIDFRAGELPTGPRGPRGAPGAPGVEAAADPIVGSWIVSMDRGPTVPPVKSLQTFTKGRGLVTAQNLGAAVSNQAFGAWRPTGPGTYASTSLFFRYHPTNTSTFIGTTKLRCTSELAPDGNSFTSVCSPEFRDAAGNLEPGSNVRRDPSTAERINVEPIPALP